MTKIFFEKRKKHKESRKSKKDQKVYYPNSSSVYNEADLSEPSLLADKENDAAEIRHTDEPHFNYGSTYVDDHGFSETEHHSISHSEDTPLSDIESISITIRTKSGQTIDVMLHLENSF